MTVPADTAGRDQCRLCGEGLADMQIIGPDVIIFTRSAQA